MRKLLLLTLAFLGAFDICAQPATDFSVTDSQGNPHDLYGDYVTQNKLVVVEIFFTACPPCATHAPYFQSLYQSMRQQHGDKVEFMLMTIRPNDNNTKLNQYKVDKNLSMPGISAEGGSLLALTDYMGGIFGPFEATPTFFLVAPGTGEVYWDVRGDDPEDTMVRLANLINHLLVPAPPGQFCEVQTRSGELLQNVDLNVQTAGWDTAFVSATGAYNLAGIAPLQNTLPHYVRPAKNNAHLNGVTTWDLVLMSRHILNITPLPEAWQRRAGDVNGSGGLTTFDILETQKLILGIYDSFPAVPSWVFEPDSAWDVNGHCLFFTGIKKGDVNGSASGSDLLGPADDRSGPALVLRGYDRFVRAGSEFACVFSLSNLSDLAALQVYFDVGAAEMLGASAPSLPGFTAANHHAVGERLSIGWYTPEAIHGDGEGMLVVRGRALKDALLSELLSQDPGLFSVAYDGVGTAYPLELVWEPADRGAQFWPNPAREFVYVADGGEAPAVWSLVDGLGHTVYREVMSGQDGALRLSPGRLPAGVYAVCKDGRVVGKICWQR